jgi:hypothetical protein
MSRNLLQYSTIGELLQQTNNKRKYLKNTIFCIDSFMQNSYKNRLKTKKVLFSREKNSLKLTS